MKPTKCYQTCNFLLDHCPNFFNRTTTAIDLIIESKKREIKYLELLRSEEIPWITSFNDLPLGKIIIIIGTSGNEYKCLVSDHLPSGTKKKCLYFIEVNGGLGKPENVGSSSFNNDSNITAITLEDAQSMKIKTKYYDFSKRKNYGSAGL